MKISFTIPITPKSVQSGARIGVVNGRRIMFNNKDKKAYMDSIVALCAQYRPPAPFTGPVLLSVRFALKRPMKLMRKKDPVTPVWSVSKPDLTNLVKSLEDAMTQCGFWHDDSQICRHETEKCHTAKGEAPHIRITITSDIPAPA